MIKYMRFDAVSFLKDSKKWEQQKKEKQEELDSITELPGISNNAPSKSGVISNPVLTVAAQREYLEYEISCIEGYQEALSYARSRLSKAQNELIDIFFFRDGYVDPLIDKYGLKWGLSRYGVYEMRLEVLDKLATTIRERYDL